MRLSFETRKGTFDVSSYKIRYNELRLAGGFLAENWVHDEFTSEQMAEIRQAIVQQLQALRQVLRSDADQTVELDQARVGRLARMDAMQHQQIAKAQLATAKVALVRFTNVLEMFDSEPEEFGYCLHCEEVIPFKRLMLRPDSRICVPCLEAK